MVAFSLFSDLTFFLDLDIANYADDNTPYATSKDIESVIRRLESDSIILFQCSEG